MEPVIEVIDDAIFYTIEELDIEIQLAEINDSICAEYFTNDASSDYWDANWERIEEEVLNYLTKNT